jgi:hypothetical protein
MKNRLSVPAPLKEGVVLVFSRMKWIPVVRKKMGFSDPVTVR